MNFSFRLRSLRPCNQLLFLIFFGNVFYLVYYVTTTTNTSEEMTPADFVDSIAVEKHIKGLTVTSESTLPIEPTFPPEPTLSNLCPEDPPTLLGALACDCDPSTDQDLISGFHEIVEPGGRVRPKDCQPRERTAIIIPYRERSKHLRSLLRMLIPILKRQQADATLFVIEQVEPDFFNKGALLNVGFLEAKKLGNFDCFIFHDGYMVPLNDRILYRCGDRPHHLVVTIKFGIWHSKKVMPQNDTGGVIAFTRQQYQRINGNSNIYFAFDGVDDDLYLRLTNKNMTLDHASADVATYQQFSNERQEVPLEIHDRNRFQILKSATRRQDVEGLNSSKYKVEEIRVERLYTSIRVSLDMAQVLRTAPVSTLRDIKHLLVKTSRT